MVKKIIHTFLINILTFIVSIFCGIIIARGLGPSGKGTHAFILLIPMTLFAFLSLNYFVTNIYFIKKKLYPIKCLFFAGLLFFSIISLLEILGLIIVNLFVEINYLGFIILFILVINMNRFLDPFLLGIGKLKQRNNLNLLKSIFTLFFLFLFYFNFKTYFNISVVLIIQFLGLLITILISLRIIFNNTRKSIKEKHHFKEIFNNLLNISKYGYISNLSNYLNYRLDQWLIKVYLSYSSLGIYSVATGLSEKFWMVSDSISSVLYPEVSETKNLKKITQGIDKMILIVFFSGIIIWIIIYFIFDYVVIFVYGYDFIKVSIIIKILFPGIILFSIVKIISGFFAGIGRPDLKVRIAIVSTIINLIANVLLIPSYGIKGAAFATVISYSLHSIYIIVRYLHVKNNLSLYIHDGSHINKKSNANN